VIQASAFVLNGQAATVQALADNLCRCGVHNRVVRAVQKPTIGPATAGRPPSLQATKRTRCPS
jgi:xanthine dehydrogenase iron-sulfur cluster and FAD-binding subunit A